MKLRVYGALIMATLVILGAGYRLGMAKSSALPSPDAGDTVEIYRLLATFHRAASTQALDLMMSVWADGATLSVRDEMYVGKDQIRDWLTHEAGPFKAQNYWMALTPLQMIRIDLRGDEALLYFESHFVDAVTTAMKSQMASHAVLVRSDGKWRIKDLKAVPASLLQ